MIDVASGFAIGGIGILTVVLATRQLSAGEDGTGYLNAAIGVGGLLGAIGSGLVVVRSRLSLPLIAGVVAFALGLAGLGLSSALGTGFVMLAVASAGSLLVEVVSTTLLQRIVPPGARGRAIGSIQTVGTLAYASGSFALPILADRLGVAPVLGATAVLVVGAGILGTALVGRAGAEAGDPELAAVARRVAGLPLFAGIPAFRVASTLARGTTLQVGTGDPIIRQGEPADRFYVILDGTVEVSRSEAPGEPARRIRSLGPDDAFGELGLLTGAARSATVTAETPGPPAGPGCGGLPRARHGRAGARATPPGAAPWSGSLAHERVGGNRRLIRRVSHRRHRGRRRSPGPWIARGCTVGSIASAGMDSPAPTKGTKR